VAKTEAAIAWCEHATAYTASASGKPWRYALIPHDLIAETKTLEGLVQAARYSR